MEDPSFKEDKPRVLKVLEALKQASHELQAHPNHNSADSNSSAIKALLELETESDSILSKDPHLSTLSQHLADLKILVETLEHTRGHGLRSFLSRRVSTHSISRVAGSIESEIQAWIDRESIESLIKGLKEPWKNEDELVRLLTQFEDRVSQGFDRELQNLVLKSKAFPVLQSVLCDPSCSKWIRENAAFCVAALIRFNKDVFVGQVNMEGTIQALLDMRSTHCLKVLCELIKFTKSPFVDEIESNGQIPKILNLLESKDLDMKVLAFDCILVIGYFGRKEAVEAMLKGGLIEKLVELQSSELGGDLIEMGNFDDESKEIHDKSRDEREKIFLENHPFASCVARFAVQLEVGEGLRQREKRAFKKDILQRIKEASIGDAEAATIIAEVLWGSSP
ncbi:Armadillo-like helical [Corchorus olitorius]|uniref:Armadillo-like helical n=1 Tax=Corchorus olitorius TaxID=93759 RepID=A0A1R3JMB0_9ROSI|nr:Armadillo-like helical [Corchorus olitorius]